ncbi:MAG: HEAT repeat domain-containing protein [Planctomycetes bacterium]|nr:HEAT repeat domain-containing protein [Planctomycetota bacterium]
MFTHALLGCALLASAQHPSGGAPSDGPRLIIRKASTEGEEAIARIQTAPDLEVSLYAAEPMVANLVALYVADDGAVYGVETFRSESGVTDMREHMGWLDYELKNTTVEERVEMHRHYEGEDSKIFAGEPERIRLLRDTDGDHVADVSTVYADQFNEPADGIAAGVLVRGKDVWFTCIPSLWKLRDNDGDDVADEVEALSTGYGIHIALRGHDLHGLRFGPDGRLYFSVGDRGVNLTNKEGEHLYLPHTGAVFRCEPDGSDLEFYATGLRNPQELVFDDHGNLFTGDNNSDGGDRARWVYVVQHGDTGWRFHYQYLESPWVRGPWNDEKLWHPHHQGQAAYIVPPIANFINGPSGLTYYPGTGLTSDYDGHFFLCEFRGNAAHSGVMAFDLIPQGASFAMNEPEKFLWGTLTTDIDFGPDGSMYFSDWVHGWNKSGKGRIYRASSTAGEGEPLRQEVQQLLGEGMEGRGTIELMELLAHRDRRVRQEAQFALVDLGAEGMRGFVKVLRQSRERMDRLHAIWGIGQLERKSPTGAVGFLPSLLYEEDEELRANAARVLGDLKHSDVAYALEEKLENDTLRVRHLAAIALGEMGQPSSVEPLVKLIDDTGDADPVLRHSAVMGLLGCATDEVLAGLADHESVHVRMAVLLCYRRKGSVEIARFLNSEDPMLFTEACRAVYDVPIEAALPSLAAQIAREDVPNAACARRIMAANHRVGGAHRALELARLASEGSHREKFRVEALELLADWSDAPVADRVHGAYWPVAERDAEPLDAACALLVERGILRASDKIATAFIELAKTAKHTASGPALAAVVSDGAKSGALRGRALAALHTVGAEEWQAALEVGLQSSDGDLRGASLGQLRKLDPAQALARAESALQSGSAPERRAAYTVLGALADPKAAALLTTEVEKLTRGEVAAEVSLELIQAAESKDSAPLHAALDARKAQETDAALARWVESMEGGDALRGEALFLSKAELSCLRCHRAEATDEPAVGPNLSGLSERMTRREILTSIVDPNRDVAEDFESWTLLLTDDEVLSGRILSEDAENLVLIDAEGEVYDVKPGEIQERKRALSSMPEGLTGFLTRSEMRDLIEYLSTL